MNKVFASALIGLAMVSVSARAEEQKAAASAAETAAVEQAEPVEVGNKICPISHEEVGKNGMEPYKMTYNGKVYSLCCGMCVKDFNKDPEKYSKMMDEEAAQEKAAQEKAEQEKSSGS